MYAAAYTNVYEPIRNHCFRICYGGPMWPADFDSLGFAIHEPGDEVTPRFHGQVPGCV